MAGADEIESLKTAIAGLQRADEALGQRIDGLTIPISERTKIAHAAASDWLRLVNNITWTLTSIFLVAALIALNGASQNGVDPLWRFSAYLAVLALCAVWWRVDYVYAKSAADARAFLLEIELTWQGDVSFYKKQRDNKRFLHYSIYAPIVFVALVAAVLALKTANIVDVGKAITAWAKQTKTETAKPPNPSPASGKPNVPPNESKPPPAVTPSVPPAPVDAPAKSQ